MEVIIDTDPGGDDAIALLWLASLAVQQRLKLVAVTTAAGNVGADITWRNAIGILTLCGLPQVPVGVAPPANAERNAAEVHGSDGIGGLAQSLPGVDACSRGARTRAPESSQLLGQLLHAAPGVVSLLAVAPLSNLARAEQSAPGVLGMTRELLVMGGSLAGGNVTPKAEFNFYFDAPSAAQVLAARPDTRLVTLDTSQSLCLSDRAASDIVQGFEAQPAAIFFRRLCAFMCDRDARLSGMATRDGFPVHDAATVAWLAYPELVQSRSCQLQIETGDGAAQGQTLEIEPPAGSRCEIACAADNDLILQRLAADLRLLFGHLRDRA